MNIFKKMLNGFFASPRQLSINEIDRLYGGVHSHSGEVVTDNSALALATVWRCVGLLAGTVASLPLNVYRADKAGVRNADLDHPLYKILHNAPNYDQTAFDFWHFMECAIELRGNSYARITRNSVGSVSALTPLAPASVSVTRQTDGSLKYRWTENSKYYEGTENDVFHVRGFGGDPLGGLSPLSICRNVFGNAIAADKTAGDMFRNGLRPSGVLTFTQWLNDEQRKVAENQLAAKIGNGNGGVPLILEGGTTWDQITLTPEDAQMLQSRSFSVEEICRLFGVPPHMVGHTEKTTSWGSGIEQQTLAFLQFTLRERLKRFEQAIEKQLLTAEDRAKGVSVGFNFESLLRADSQGRAAFYLTMTQIGAMTINEVRALENLPPVEGGSVPRIQSQNQPISQADEDDIRDIIREENAI